ncbi:MAG TPA: TolC family protein, partial [Parasegetibacter sp.]
MKNSLLPIFRKIFRPSTVFLLFVFLTVNAYSQTGLEQVLSSVLKNSDALNANKKYWEAKRAENKSSMSLENPTLEYDYLFGYPAGSGNLTEFAITQQFDFPTAYGRKKELFRQQQKLSELSQQAYRQEILLRAKLIYLEMVWLNRKQHLINERSVRTQEFVFNYQEKLDKGAATILEVNKAKLQLLNIRKDSSLNQQEINARLTQLAELNGGQWITVTD